MSKTQGSEPVKTLEELGNLEQLVFAKRKQEDGTTQFWCEEVRCSIFIVDGVGVILAGPCHGGVVAWAANRMKLERDKCSGEVEHEPKDLRQQLRIVEDHDE